MNGDFHKRDNSPEVLVPPIPFQVNLSIFKFYQRLFIIFSHKADNVSQLFIDQISINSLFKHVFDTHILNLTIFGNMTDTFQIKLDSRSIGSPLSNELYI